MCLSPVFGRLGRHHVAVGARRRSRSSSGAWPPAAPGWPPGYLILFFTRCLVGVGEAAYGPVAPAMLSDLYPVDHRGRVMSWFYMAIPVGSAWGS